MPNISIKIPTGAFTEQQRHVLQKSVSEAAITAEQIGEGMQQRSLCWVLIEEVPSKDWLCGGLDVHALAIPCIIVVKVPAGILDDQMRGDYVKGLHQAMVESLPAEEKRPLMTSIQLVEVLDGTWGANGNIWRLDDFTRAAGFRHLLPA